MSARAAGFATLVHADWSAGPAGRWAARATRTGTGWTAEAPVAAANLAGFTAGLLDAAARGPVLAGFDFPLGLPVGYGRRTGFAGFKSALPRFGRDDWADFGRVAAAPEEVGLRRPFYPAAPGGASHRHLLDGHGVAGIGDLTRACERGGKGARAAGCLFWTLGGNQVGKAMLVGWHGVVGPALERGARLWPFDGDLGPLARRGGLTLAETYPADVYARLGARFGPRESKRRRDDRARKAPALLAWADAAGVVLAPALRAALADGFGAADKGGDRFDAVVGLLGMIGTVDGRWPAGAPDDDDVRRWEGWILGRAAPSDAVRS